MASAHASPVVGVASVRAVQGHSQATTMIERIQGNLTREQELEVLREDLAIYRQIENWGVTLLVTAIALISKQLHDTMGPSLSELIAARFFGVPLPGEPSDALLSSPVFVGVVGSFFLFHINWRGRAIRKRIYDWKMLKPRGLLGWLFGVTPFVLSLSLSFAYLGMSLKNLWLDACVLTGVVILSYQARGEWKLWKADQTGPSNDGSGPMRTQT